MPYAVMGLFSGAGGLNYGFTTVPEYEVVAANEFDGDIERAYSLNHPDVNMLDFPGHMSYPCDRRNPPVTTRV